MKPSHLQTPRTLAECTFVTGYTSHQEREPFGVVVVVMLVAVLAAGFLAYVGA